MPTYEVAIVPEPKPPVSDLSHAVDEASSWLTRLGEDAITRTLDLDQVPRDPARVLAGEREVDDVLAAERKL